MMNKIICIFLVIHFTPKVLSLCPYECDCRNEVSECPSGVSLITDGCNCCKICAKQLGDQCNDDEALCDNHRNLFCDYSVGRSGDWGVCRPRSGKPCWHGDIRLSSGARFEPSCKKRCWCMDGVIGCISLCPHETKIPISDTCPNARLETAEDECCDRWVCDTSSGDDVVLPLDDFWNEFVDDKSGLVLPSSSPIPELGNGIRDGLIYQDDVGDDIDDLIDYQMSFALSSEPYVNGEDNWHENNMIPGDEHARRREASALAESRKHCKIQSTMWTACSKTCGIGVSVRVSNDNVECQLANQMRICELRPCQMSRYQPKKGKQCLRQKRPRKRVTISYAGCTSMKKMRPRYCGGCQETNRCCTPKVTRTARIRFRCKDGTIFSKNLLVVRSCHCHNNCASEIQSNDLRVTVLTGDMHDSRES